MLLKPQIMQSQTFSSLSFIQKQMVVKYKNLLAIEHGLEVIKNIGEKKWLAQSELNNVGRRIVLELYKYQSNDNR